MALEALLFLPPLNLFVKALAFKSASNVRCNGWWTAKSELGHAAICNLIREDILQMPSDQCRPELWMDDKFECVIPDESKWLSEPKTYPPAGDLICYTDGSKRNGFTGAGFFCEFPLLEVSIFTGSYATVYQTELFAFAISELCKSEVIKNASGKEIYICTDSQSAIEAINSPVIDSLTVRDCKAILNKIGSSNKVTIEAITNHCGLNKYLFDIGIKDNPKCLCGHGDEMGAHIILDCIRYLGKPELAPSDVEIANLDLEKLTTFLQRTNRLA